MKELLERSGLSFNEGGISEAELSAYSKGLGLLEDYISEIENGIFIVGGEMPGLIRYAGMLKTDMSRFDTEGLILEIIRRFSLGFGQSSYSNADEQYGVVGSGEYACSSTRCVVIGAALGDLKEAGRFLASYAPCCAEKLYSGEGERLTFDMRDSIGYTFNEYDGLNLPFEFSDSLRSDIFEQH